MNKRSKTYRNNIFGHGKNPVALFFFLPFFFCDLHAQNNLKGKVESLSPDVEGIHVINKTSQSATITDARGYFEIPVREGDTLLFTAVQFHNTEITVTTDIMHMPLLTVHLRQRVTELDEVILKNLTGNLDSDLRRARTDSINAISLGLPYARVIPRTQSERRLYTSTDKSVVIDKTSLSPNIGLKTDFIINGITGRTKKLKKYLRLNRKVTTLEKIRTRYKEAFFVSSGIAREKIYDFLYFCAAQPEYDSINKTGNPMALSRFLKVQAGRYGEINGRAAAKD